MQYTSIIKYCAKNRKLPLGAFGVCAGTGKIRLLSIYVPVQVARALGIAPEHFTR